MSGLTLHGLRVLQPSRGDHTQKRQAHLHLMTPAGHARYVPLEEEELIQLVLDAARALAILRGQRGIRL